MPGGSNPKTKQTATQKACLICIDGWGVSPQEDPRGDAIRNANTPVMSGFEKKYPYTTIEAHGLAVGLPEGLMGNSEVGHLNIGAGRVVYQVSASCFCGLRMLQASWPCERFMRTKLIILFALIHREKSSPVPISAFSRYHSNYFYNLGYCPHRLGGEAQEIRLHSQHQSRLRSCHLWQRSPSLPRAGFRRWRALTHLAPFPPSRVGQGGWRPTYVCSLLWRRPRHLAQVRYQVSRRTHRRDQENRVRGAGDYRREVLRHGQG